VYEGDWLVRFAQAAREATNERQWRLPANVWGLGLTSLLTDVSSEMIVSVLPAYLVLSSGLAPLVLGIANGLHQGGPIVATLIGGLIADRSGRRKLTAEVGYAISAICRIGWLLVPGQSVTSVATLVVGDRVGKAIRTAPRDAMISMSVRSDQLATAFGVHRAMDAAGAAAGPALAFLLLWQLPRRYDVIFFTSFVIGVLGVAALMLLVEEYPERRAFSRDGSASRWRHALTSVTDCRLRPIVALATIFSIVTISDVFLYVLLVERSGAAAYWIPLCYTGTALSFLMLAAPMGYLADRLGRRRTFIAAHVPLLIAYGIALGFRAWPWNAVACVALLGAYYAASEGVLASLASSVLPLATRAIGLASVATAVSLGRMSSSIAFGLLWTRSGDVAAVLVFTAALIVVLGIAFLQSGVEEPVAS
jgi:MFS family permease